MPNSRDIIRAIEESGWVKVRTQGDHHHFKHPKSPYLVTVVHPRKDNPVGYVKKIEKLTGLMLR